ncbi:MAG: GNAT family N-acetyltransferase [Clostridia bacterium]|nr:GNAT family N-acetyltransferase [Clostridia bacterium]
MIIRFAEQGDLQGIMSLYDILVPDDAKASIDDLSKVWESIMQNPETYRYVVAEDQGRLLATCNIAIVPNLTRGARPYGIIENVVTHPDARRRGCAKAVMEKALGFARENNCYKVFLLSGSHRKEAHAFYEAIGFDGNTKRGFTYDMK